MHLLDELTGIIRVALAKCHMLNSCQNAHLKFYQNFLNSISIEWIVSSIYLLIDGRLPFN